MKDLTAQVTVFVISVERQKNYDDCLKSLSEQTVKFNLIEIKDFYPMSSAFNEMLKKGTTEFSIQCDEDMILRPDAVETMYNKIKNSPPIIVTFLFSLFDCHLQTKINGIRIFKQDILKNYPFEDILASENQQKHKLRKDNYKIQLVNKIVGDHSPHWTVESIFQRYFTFMERYKVTGSHKQIPLKLWEIIKNSPTDLNLYALLGSFASLFSKQSMQIKEKHYLKYNTKELETIKKFIKPSPIIQKSNKFQFISPDYKHPYILELTKHLNIELVQNDLEKVKRSNKALILWNPYGYLKIKSNPWKLDLMNDFKRKNKLAYVVERGTFPGTIYIDKGGFLLDSDSYNESKWDFPLKPKELKEVDEFIENFKEDETTLEPQQNKRIDFHTFFNRIETGKKIVIFVPMQVHDDTVIQLWSGWVKNLLNFQGVIKEMGKNSDRIIFLVKNHPVEEQYIMKESKNVKIVDNFHYKDCIDYCDIVLSINSSVGLQAMLWNKPVILTGKAFFQFEGINYKTQNEQEMRNLFFHVTPPNIAKIKRFVHYLIFKFYSHCEIEIIKKGISKPIKFNKVTFEK